ncbi:small RNA 2'-O-methyltransferase [Entomortierella parvispora]|uniref:Small RNA 2'-O-methyltransferase n=1 Tax=Entomortierella parvispora TaxID=205924 RepID=A0A9P3LXA3_9FUNG|nr:small RNA 2'-O-methyltransferase [Entomortierella parvispora]
MSSPVEKADEGTLAQEAIDAVAATEASEEARFFPPLWQQRRNLARSILDKEHATSIIDFGCGEAALTSFLISETDGDYPVTRLAGVDMDADSLAQASHQCQPQDYELGENVRVHNLEVELFKGSVAQADKRLLGFDALACMEVVEHLDPEVLDEFWGVVLGTLKPKLVIVSTPNAEFNIYFPQLNYGTENAILRNDDHRFEWTRQEFQTWCQEAADKYGYSVEFTGVGRLLNQDPLVGCCTQVGVLRDMNPSRAPRMTATEEVYTLFTKIVFPTYDKVHTDEDTVAYILERIARTRPLPPPSQEEQDKENAERAREGLDPWVWPAVELGRMPLEDLWLDKATRQRCKKLGNMVRILEKSPLVNVDVAQNLVTFDEENEFWAESDRQKRQCRRQLPRI